MSDDEIDKMSDSASEIPSPLATNNSHPQDGKNSSRCDYSCRFPSREQAFGVAMNKGIAAKITDPAKFIKWSWWVHLTPSFASTVFSRPWLHVQVLINLFFGNASFYYTYGGLHTPGVAVRTSLVVRLLVFVLASYVGKIVDLYHVGTRRKAGDLIRNMAMVVDTLSVCIDYQNERSPDVLRKLHGAINAIGHYAFAHASSDTKFRLSKQEMAKLFEDRGYDAAYLLSFHKKQTVSVMRLGILQTLQQERTRPDGCLATNLDSIQWQSLQQSLSQMSGGAMSLMSCTSSNKLPFCYTQLVNWGTRITLFFFTVLVFSHAAEEYRAMDLHMPFTCFDKTWDRMDPPDCATMHYIFFNAAHVVGAYFVLGCLELYRCLSQIWQSGLVLSNYLGIVDLVCEPMLPSCCNDETRIKDLDTLQSKQ